MERLSSPEHALKDFEGTYIGISPTDESDIGLGELEITIDATAVRSRWATGLEIQEDEIPAEEVRELFGDELQALLVDGAQLPPGMRAFDVAGLHYIFLDQSRDPDAACFMIVGGMGDILGPTGLFSPEQVARGLHEKAFRDLEREFGQPGEMPRLNNGGLAPHR